MYSIAEIIYGIPLVSNTNENITYSEELEIMIEDSDETEGFLSFYSGAADQSPAAFGVVIGEFDECCAFVEESDFQKKPSSEQKEEFQKLWDKVNSEIKLEITEKFGSRPRVFILWSTS